MSRRPVPPRSPRRRRPAMERFTISLDADLAAAFDAFIRARGYGNRSEAVRDLLRERIGAQQLAADAAPYCIATLSYIYNHHERELAERLTALQHAHHDLGVATMHAHLDHDNCVETVILRGATAAVRAFAEALQAERGVRHGQLNLVPAEADSGGRGHRHAHPAEPGHLHSRPKI